MSVVTYAPGELEAHVTLAKQMLAYFETHKDRLLRCTNLTMHPELFTYGDEEQLTAFLKNVGENIYRDIESKSDLFRVGNLGSIWYDKEYKSHDGVKHLVRIGLIGNFNPSGVDFENNKEFDERVKFFFNVDILDLM